MLAGRWGSCNASCLVRVGVKRREVECRDRITELLSDDCNPERRPIDTRRCYHRRQCDKSGNCIRQGESVIKAWNTCMDASLFLFLHPLNAHLESNSFRGPLTTSAYIR